MLQGRVPNEILIWEAGRVLADRMIEITGRRLSVVYKEPAIQGLFVRMMLPLIRITGELVCLSERSFGITEG